MEFYVGKYTLLLSSEVLYILDFHKQKNKHSHEKGGIIIGKVIENTIIIEKLSVPSELDTSSRLSFVRHRLSAQIIIDYEFFNSNGTNTYLGEWHTHPENIPVPSQTDKKMINEQFKTNTIHTNFLILLIQGLQQLYIGIIDDTGLNTAIYTTYEL